MKNTRVAINLVMSCRRYEFQSDAVDKRMMNYSRGLVRQDLVWSLLTTRRRIAKLSILNLQPQKQKAACRGDIF